MGCGSSSTKPVADKNGKKFEFSSAANIGPKGVSDAPRRGKKGKRGGRGGGERSEQTEEDPPAARPARGGSKKRGKGKAGAAANNETDASPATNQLQGKGKKDKKKAGETPHEGDNEEPAAPALPGKEKYFPCPLVNEVREQGAASTGVVYYASVFSHISDLRGLTFAVRDPAGIVHIAEFTDEELGDLREKQKLQHPWPSFWKSLNNTFVKANAKSLAVRKHDDKLVLEMVLSSTKDPKHQPFAVELVKKGEAPYLTAKYFLEPFQRFQSHNAPTEKGVDRSTELAFWRREATTEEHERRIGRADKQIKSARKYLEELETDRESVKQQLQECEAHYARLKKGDSAKNFLDKIYAVGKGMGIGGARSFDGHTPHRASWEPNLNLGVPNECIMAMVRDKFKLAEQPSDPALKEILAKAESDSHLAVMKCFEKLDDWDYDIFAVAEHTEGGALFHTAYALLHKHHLPSHFELDHERLVLFLRAVQSGYRPNHYHNSTHAADVLHITHYAIGPGGLGKMLNLTQEDILAALIAATVHDFDHPGFNNNFHTRTSAYLSTLYSDRSILENHHCASIFEMIQTEQYDIFSALTEDQRREVRDATVDMLLSTDMGNHAKIFSAFRRRLNDAEDWGGGGRAAREDGRLALIMAIKMADISNCARPLHLYLKWSKNIATEFYHQGDAELKLGLPISPFMDRRKDKTDFSKGQISFINFIVIPLFEAMVELLPKLDFTVKLCQENKDHWQKVPDAGSGASTVTPP